MGFVLKIWSMISVLIYIIKAHFIEIYTVIPKYSSSPSPPLKFPVVMYYDLAARHQQDAGF